MDGRGRPRARLFVSRALQHSEHLQQSDAARAGRRRGDDFVTVIMAVQRLAFLSLVGFQIRQRDQAAIGRHRGSQLLRSFTIIEIARTAIPNPLQSGSQFRLDKLVAIVRA